MDERKQCAEQTHRYGVLDWRCSRKARPGSDYCAQHDPVLQAERRAKSDAEWLKSYEESVRRRKRDAALLAAGRAAVAAYKPGCGCAVCVAICGVLSELSESVDAGGKG